MMVEPVRRAFKNRWRFKERTWMMGAGLLMCWLVWTSVPVVVNMRPIPETWCRTPTTIQVRMAGMKIKSWVPIHHTETGRADYGLFVDDVEFHFVDDVSPGSSKPKWASDFGVWEWVTTDAIRVRMVMRHADPNSLVTPQVGDMLVYAKTRESVFGFYDVPMDMADCA